SPLLCDPRGTRRQERGSDRGLRRCEGPPRAPGEAAGVVDGDLEDLAARLDAFDQPDLQGLLRVEASAAVDEPPRSPGPDERREALRAARAGDHAEADLRLAEGRVVRGVPEVATEGQLEPAAQGVAVDRGDRDLRQRFEEI